DVAAAYERRGPRPFVEAEVVPISRWITELPHRTAGGRVQAGYDFLIIDPVEDDEPLAGHNRTTETGADSLTPNDGWSAFGPGLQKPGLHGDPIACRSEKLGPIRGRGGDGDDESGQQNHVPGARPAWSFRTCRAKDPHGFSLELGL